MSFAVDFGTSKGLGLHEVDIPAADDAPLLVAEYVTILLFNPALMATKTSILLLYLRLARDQKKFLRIASYVTLAVVNVGGIALTFTTAFQCRPVKAAYDLTVANPICISIETIYLASAPVNVTTDLAIFVLPIPVLTGLRLPRRQKSILLLTFVLGAFVTVVDVVRIYFMQLAATSLDILPSGLGRITSLEFSYNASMALMWSVIEVNVGIICACIPTLRPLVKRLAPVMVSEHARSSGEHELMEVSSSSQGGASLDSWGRKKLLQQRSPTEVTADTVVANPHSIYSAPPAEYQEQQQIKTNRMVREPERPLTQNSNYSVLFGFIHIVQQPRSVVDIQGSESIKFWALIAGLLFFVGFAYGMLISISSEIFTVVDKTQAIGISSAIYGGSAAGPVLGQWILRRVGFKTTFVTSLGICCCGTLMFWPSGALHSYAGFVISSFVVGFGLGLLDLTANAFFMLCGPPRYAEFRLLLGQSVEAVAGALSALLSTEVFSVNVIDTRSFIAIQWAYLAIAVLTVLLGLFYYYIPLPEASDSDMQDQLHKLGIDPSQKYYNRFPVNFTSLTIAALSAFCAGGGLVCIRTFTSNLFTTVSTKTHSSLPISRSNFSIFLTAIYAISQALFAVLTLFIPPRILLLLTYAGCITFTALLAALDFPTVAGVEALALVFAILGGSIPSLIFAIGMRGLGRWTKVAACVIESGTDLGACVAPFVMLAVVRAHDAPYSFGVIIALFAVGFGYPLYLNSVPAARHLVDARSYIREARQG
jgi:fucose permease